MENKIKQIENNKIGKKNSLNNAIYKWGIYIITAIVALTILGAVIIIISRGIETILENDVSLGNLFLSNEYVPIAGKIGMGFLVINTLWLAFCASLVATPISIGTALVITRVLKGKASSIMFSIVAILAAIPSVVYGAFGYHVIEDFFTYKLNFTQGSLGVMVIMLSFMIMPTITIMTIASIRLTDRKLEDSSYALGANKTQTSFYITLRSAKTGIYTGIIFAVGRCLAETTAISMVFTPASFYDGITLMWWQSSLFLAPALLAAGSTGEIRPMFPFASIISMFLLITTLTVFAFMKWNEYKTSETTIVKKQNREYSLLANTRNKIEQLGIEELTSKEQKILSNYENRIMQSDKQMEYYRRPDVASLSILDRSSVSDDDKYHKYKRSKAIKHNSFIYISSGIGILLLASIFAYLMSGGFELLNWNTLTSRGIVPAGDGTYYYGLAVPIIGTYISVLISILIALPLGIVLGICLSTYIDKKTKIGWFVSYIFQGLTAIPGIVWATFATMVFAGTIIATDYLTIEPILFLIVIILPTIIKSVEEAGGRVNHNKIDGSYALGATTLTTTRRIYLKEVFPSIISGALLATSIAMAESTIFIAIIPTKDVINPAEDINTWFSTGGFTLSMTIYSLNKFDALSHPEAGLEIKTIGLIMMILVLSTSYSSTLINSKKYTELLLLLIAIILFPLSFYVNEGSVILTILTVVFAAMAVIVVPILNLIRKKE